MTVTDDSPRLDQWEKFFTVKEVAAILGVSMMTVYRLVREERLLSIRVGRSYRIPESAVNKATREGVPG